MTSFSIVGVVLAAVLAFAFTVAYYTAFSKSWMTAAGYSAKPAFKVGPLSITFLAELVTAGMLAGLTAHIGTVTVWNTFVTGILAWAGFTLTTMVVNHSFEARSRALTWINSGHWLGVYLIMSVVIGLFGN